MLLLRRLGSVMRGNAALRSAAFSSELESPLQPIGEELMRFAVLVTGKASQFCQEKYGEYSKLCSDLCLKSEVKRERLPQQWDYFFCYNGEFPHPKNLDLYRAFVISGGKYDAHSNDHEWIPKLRRLILNIYERKRSKIVGLCFGHQAVAKALGGNSGRAPGGWEVGIKHVNLDDSAIAKLPWLNSLNPSRQLQLLQIHRDQVLELPPHAIPIGSSDKTRYEIFAISNRILCIQGHPEFNRSILQELIESRRDVGIIPADDAAEALKSLVDNDPSTKEVQRIIHGFLDDPLDPGAV